VVAGDTVRLSPAAAIASRLRLPKAMSPLHAHIRRTRSPADTELDLRLPPLAVRLNVTQIQTTYPLSPLKTHSPPAWMKLSIKGLASDSISRRN
jgi:hypothetical protein